MKIRMIGAIALLGIVQLAFSQSQTAFKDASALKSLERTLLTLGTGVKGQSYRLTGDLIDPASRAPIGSFTLQVRGSDFKCETDKKGTKNIFIAIGGSGFTGDGKSIRHLAPYDTTDLSPDIVPNLSTWTRFDEPDSEVSLIERSVSVDENLLRIRVKVDSRSRHLNHHLSQDVFIDSTTSEVRVLSYQATQGAINTSTVEIRNEYSEYKTFGGLRVPTVVNRFIHGKLVAILRIDDVQTGVVLDPELLR